MFKTTHEIDEQKVADLLCCAFEGGIGYWAVIADYKKSTRTSVNFGQRYVDYPIDDGAVYLEEAEGFSGKGNTEIIYCNGEPCTVLTLNREALEHGIAVMSSSYPQHFSDFVKDNFDAITGDVFVQCCLFGEIVYG